MAPIFPHARAFKESGAYVIGIVGFRSKELMFWQDKFGAVCDQLIVCTDDGSAGIKGMVTAGIKKALREHDDIDEFVVIGPPVMMKGWAEATRARKVRTMVSLNPLMVDGTGMCGGCRVKIGGEVKFACVDGPDFDGHQVDFDDLMTRLRRFTEQEKAAAQRWSGSCRMAAAAAGPETASPASSRSPRPSGARPTAIASRGSASSTSSTGPGPTSGVTWR